MHYTDFDDVEGNKIRLNIFHDRKKLYIEATLLDDSGVSISTEFDAMDLIDIIKGMIS